MPAIVACPRHLPVAGKQEFAKRAFLNRSLGTRGWGTRGWGTRAKTCISLLTLSVFFTLLNCVKPLHVDDAAYVLHAAHIADSPLEPYDSVIYWDYQFHQGNALLAPPVVPYWIAAAQAILGDQPFLWKLTLLPLNIMLAAALFVLLQRWATALAMPLAWMTLLSPALLPSANLMLDVPALALSLAAVAIFARAGDRQSWGLAVLAGLLAGLAMQTKYSAMTTPAVLLAYGLIHGRVRLALAACATAVLLFAAWELFVTMQHGDSHFLTALGQRTTGTWSRIRHLLIPTAALTAALAPGVFFVSVLGCKRSGWWWAAAVLALTIGFLLLGIIPDEPGATVKIDGVLYGCLTVLWWSASAPASFGRLAAVRRTAR